MPSEYMLNLSGHIEELELKEPSWWVSCCLSTGGSGRMEAGEEWHRALSLIPIKDMDSQRLFRVRMSARAASAFPFLGPRDASPARAGTT